MDDKQTPDPVDQFLNQILDEKKIAGSEDPEVRSQLIDDLRSRLMSQIDREMIAERRAAGAAEQYAG